MKQIAVLHPTGSGAWVCSFPETPSEPNVLAHDQMIYDLGQQRDALLADNERLRKAIFDVVRYGNLSEADCDKHQLYVEIPRSLLKKLRKITLSGFNATTTDRPSHVTMQEKHSPK